MRSTYSDDISQSLYNYLSNLLLEQGAYVNVARTDRSARGIQLGKFYPVVDKRISSVAGIVWQSAFHNLIYESGVVNSPTPTVISGVYINDVFAPKTGGSNPHTIDFRNGRVIFNSPVATSSTILADFSYSEFSFVRPTQNEKLGNDNEYTPNSKILPTGVPASPDEIFLPVILFECEGNRDKPFQLGGVNSVAPEYKLTILSTKQSQIEQVADLFVSQMGKSFSIVPLSEGPRFNSLGDTLETYSFYSWRLKTSNLGTFESVRYDRYFDSRREGDAPKVFAGTVRMEIFALRI